MTTEELAPIFAQQAYNMLGSKSKDDRIKAINENIKHTGYNAVKTKSNRDVLYLEHPEKKQVFISHRGTDFTKKNDVTADLSFALGQEKHSKHYKKRRDFTDKILKDVGDDQQVFLSGHSYGGSSVNDTLRNKKNVRDKVTEAHTFNSSFNPFLKNKLNKKVQKQLDDITTHHRVEGDLVSSNSIINNQFGKVKTYKAKEKSKSIPKKMQNLFKSVDQFNLHSLKNFIKN